MNFLPDSNCRVLVVDDEPSVCHAVRLVLTLAGYQVNTAWSSKEALTILEAERHDLVITDYTMPDMKGDELSEVIKGRWPETAVVMLTACAVNLRAAAVPLPFVDALLDKPFEVAEFRRTIKEVLAANEPYTSAVYEATPADAVFATAEAI